MGDIDPKVLAKAERRFQSLRRRSWRFFLASFGMLGVFGVCSCFVPKTIRTVTELITVLVPVLGYLACWAGAALSWDALLHFHCPRCDKFFIRSWGSTIPTATCKHCGLRLN